jgi:hypothetical protein
MIHASDLKAGMVLHLGKNPIDYSISIVFLHEWVAIRDIVLLTTPLQKRRP